MLYANYFQYNLGGCSNMSKLTTNQQLVLDYLATQRIFISPTNIANAIRVNHHVDAAKNSAWASPICKQLVNKGLITRNQNGHYKFNYFQRKQV